MLVVTKHRGSLGPSHPHRKELPLCSALASTLPIPLGPPPLSWEVWCHHHLPGTGKLSFSCPKHQVKTPRKVELPPVEGTGVCALPNHAQAEPGCPDHLWKWEVPCKGAEKQLDWSSASLGAGCPCTPCQPERCHLTADSGGYSRNRNNAPQQSCEAANPPRESKCTDATTYIYLSICSATDPQAYLQDVVSAQPSCPAATAARLGTRQRCRTQPGSILTPPRAPGTSPRKRRSRRPCDTGSQSATKSSHH